MVSGDTVAALMFAVLTLALLVGGVMRIVWVVLYDEYIGVGAPPTDPPLPSRFEVVMRDRDGPGRYCVRGVMTAIEADVVLWLAADSSSGARQKAERGGVVVTNVTAEA